MAETASDSSSRWGKRSRSVHWPSVTCASRTVPPSVGVDALTDGLDGRRVLQAVEQFAVLGVPEQPSVLGDGRIRFESRLEVVAVNVRKPDERDGPGRPFRDDAFDADVEGR